MSNEKVSKIIRSNTIKFAHQERGSKFRVYIAEEAGAKLVRHASSTSLARAIKTLARFGECLAWEIREFRNGVERLIHVEEHKL